MGYPYIDEGDGFHKPYILSKSHGPASHTNPVPALYGDESLAQLFFRCIDGKAAHIFHGLLHLSLADRYDSGPGPVPLLLLAAAASPDIPYRRIGNPHRQASICFNRIFPAAADKQQRLLGPHPYLLYPVEIHSNLSKYCTQIPWEYF